MKRTYVSEGRPVQGLRIAAWCAGTALLSTMASAGEADAPVESTDVAPESAAADESLSNWIDVVMGGAAIGGRDAAFKRRFGGPEADFYGGIEDFHYELLTDSGTFQMDGHALPGLEDYGLKLRYDWDDIGFVRFGYREFRTWYDGSGGYLPQVAPPWDWVAPEQDELSIDRGEIGVEAGLRVPDIPHITFAYWHRWRDGMKDSTSWGRLDSSDSPVRQGIIPSYWDIDETVDIFKFDILHTVQTPGVEITLGGGMRYHRVRTDNTRVENQGKGTADPEDDRRISQMEDYDADLYNAHLFNEFRVDEDVIASLGYSFTTMDTNIGGDRLSVDRIGNDRSQDHAYKALVGGTQTTIHVVNANLWWNPFEDIVVIPSVRAEFWDQAAWGFHEEGNRRAPADAPVFDPLRQRSSYEYETFTEQLELRYSGVPDVLLYAKGMLSQSDGDFSRSDDDLMGGGSFRSNDIDFDQEKITVGANWYPIRKVSVAAQYYYRHLDQDFDNHVLDGDDAQIKDHEARTHDVNLRLTVRPLPNVTLVSRYDYQQTDIENSAIQELDDGTLGATRKITSGDIERHIFSESVTWVPVEWLYLQGSLHYVESSTDTDADSIPGFDSRIVPDWSNDYWMLNFNAGITLSDQTNLQLGYFYYDADNFVDNSDVGTPYGTEAKEHAFTARLTHQFTPAMSANIGYGYFKGEDDAYGGHRDYDAHVISGGFRHSF